MPVSVHHAFYSNCTPLSPIPTVWQFLASKGRWTSGWCECGPRFEVLITIRA